MKTDIQDVLKFSAFLLEFQAVRRKIVIPDREERENDAEHSYALAMMGWYLNEANGWGLDTGKILKYALVHDIPETYAGDISTMDKQGRKAKVQREAAALEHIETKFPAFRPIGDWVRDYEKRADKESKFVYVLDKLLPMAITYQEGGTLWRDDDHDVEDLLENFRHLVADSSQLKPLAEEIEDLVRKEPTLFNQH